MCFHEAVNWSSSELALAVDWWVHRWESLLHLPLRYVSWHPIDSRRCCHLDLDLPYATALKYVGCCWSVLVVEEIVCSPSDSTDARPSSVTSAIGARYSFHRRCCHSHRHLMTHRRHRESLHRRCYMFRKSCCVIDLPHSLLKTNRNGSSKIAKNLIECLPFTLDNTISTAVFFVCKSRDGVHRHRLARLNRCQRLWTLFFRWQTGRCVAFCTRRRRHRTTIWIIITYLLVVWRVSNFCFDAFWLDLEKKMYKIILIVNLSANSVSSYFFLSSKFDDGLFKTKTKSDFSSETFVCKR